MAIQWFSFIKPILKNDVNEKEQDNLPKLDATTDWIGVFLCFSAHGEDPYNVLNDRRCLTALKGLQSDIDAYLDFWKARFQIVKLTTQEADTLGQSMRPAGTITTTDPDTVVGIFNTSNYSE